MFSSLAGWFHDVLGYLGWLPKNAKMCFLGLDNAGKTTLIQLLSHDVVSTREPTFHPHSEELLIGGIRFRTYDVGGHLTARRIWKDYYAAVDGVVFVVDAADRTRFAEAREELQHLLDDPVLAEVPIAVLCNKIDIPCAASEDELRHALGLWQHMTAGKDCKKGSSVARPVEVFMCSLLKRMGYAEAFQWVGKLIK